MKSFFKYIASTAVLLVLLNSCGGGGGSSNSSEAKVVNGVLKASYLKGVKVCDDYGHCAITDENGKFRLSGVKAPVHLTFSIGDTLIASYTTNKSTFTVTPKELAEGDSNVGSFLGAVLHKIAGCEINATNCDVSSINELDINENSLVEHIKNSLSDNKVSVVKDGQTIIVTKYDAFDYANNAPEMVSDIYNYKGVLSEGVIDVNVSKKDYKLSYIYLKNNGTSKSDEIQLSKINQILFKDSKSNYYLIGKNIIATALKGVNNKLYPAFALNIPEVGIIDTSKIINKRFIYIEFDNNSTPNSIKVIDINASNPHAFEGTWTSYNIYGNGTLQEADEGTWAIEKQKIAVYKEIDGDVQIGYAVVKASGDKAAFLYVDNSGNFGIGLEAKTTHLPSLDNKNYYALVYNLNENSNMSLCYSTIHTALNNNKLQASIHNEALIQNDCGDDVTIELEQQNFGLMKTSDNFIVLGDSRYFIGAQRRIDGITIVIGASQPLSQ